MILMNGSSLFLSYFVWHYSGAFRDMVSVWLNLMWFILHFFSIPLLFRTLFSPFKRVHEEYQRTGIEDLMATFVVNIMTRIIGAIVRLCIIALGLIVLLAMTMGFILSAVLWVLLPFVTVYALYYGIGLLVS